MSKHQPGLEEQLEATRDRLWEQSMADWIVAGLLNVKLNALRRSAVHERRAAVHLTPNTAMHGAWHILNSRWPKRIPSEEDAEEWLISLLEPYVKDGLLPGLEVSVWRCDGKLRASASITNLQLVPAT